MTRQDTIKAERRRRNTDALEGKRRRLAVNEASLDRDKYEYRFANDVGGRIFDLTQNDDWEVVPNDGNQTSVSEGTNVARNVGTTDKGEGIRSVLLRKPRKYYNDDEAAKQRRIDETESSIRGGTPQGAAGDGKEYVPSGGIQMEHGSRS